ncbi:lysophospholipid acyltransferase family protein [Pigmentibacter sp. JX0631]|uniref:lysophospholipid acyltransferase family protein n=1 Tax=Pigmentibacter sp. JX0631 TaxID=2976982 RepID=UPI002469BAEB|nr:lysophospholipid acyltransferase family protein [Pigmentibacter sp. JX0631]WGL59645.1 lysophospholipid acyltransferase family protein [Pigmentibacter sp. JX0631]
MAGYLLRGIRFILLFLLFFILSFLLLFVFIIRFRNKNNNVIFGKIFSYLSANLLQIKIIVKEKYKMTDESPKVIIANHQSYFDAIIFGRIISNNTLIIGKKSLVWIPIFGWVFYLAGNLFLNRTNHQKAMNTMKNVDEALQTGSSLWIFPEGTRGHSLGLKPFKKGAFYAAIQNQVPVQIVAVSNLKFSLDYKRWKAGTVLAEIMDPIETKGYSIDDVEIFIQKAYQLMKEKIEQLDNEIKNIQLESIPGNLLKENFK